MTVAREEVRLRLGKGAAFAKGRLKRLRREDDAWEADFRALPRPLTQNETHYLGMVVGGGSPLAELRVDGRPTVNDMAELLARAMRRPLAGAARRPARLHVRGHHQWRELFPHLGEVGVEVAVRRELPGVAEAYEGHLWRDRERARARAGMAVPSERQRGVGELFPAVRLWVDGGYGHLEVGDQEGLGFVARALGYGGLVFEDDRPATLAEALASLEAGLRAWFEEQGVEVG